jgi:hypothetical protein
MAENYLWLEASSPEKQQKSSLEELRPLQIWGSLAFKIIFVLLLPVALWWLLVGFMAAITLLIAWWNGPFMLD